MSIKRHVKDNHMVVSLYKNIRYYYSKYFLSDKKLIKKRFRKRLGRELELENPVRYNDKLQWLKLYWYDSLATKCADKYEVREFVNERIGNLYLNDLYEVYDSVNEIDLNKLPNSFVLKSTHGTAENIICKEKSEINWNRAFNEMEKWLRKNIFWSTREWVYKDIKPRIICERLLCDQDGNSPMDYKIFCFHGKPKLIQVDIDRFGTHKQLFFDTNWNSVNLEIDIPLDKHSKIERPNTLEKMLEISKELSKDFPHVRVDLYNHENQIIFGELTFFHRNGLGIFNPPEFEAEMGSWLNLQKE